MNRTMFPVIFAFAGIAIFCSSPVFSEDNNLELKKNAVCIVMSPEEPQPLQRAVHSLVRDFQKVMGFEPEIVDSPKKSNGRTILFVLNDSTKHFAETAGTLPPLDGFESHRVLVDAGRKTVFLHGNDMRGTIYAVYTFSQHVLNVPPLWYFCSWQPKTSEVVFVADKTDLFFKSPQIRYRAWFPNDTDMFSPWRRLSEENDTMWLETMLRLKLNTVELGTTISYPGQMSREANKLARFGLVLTSHHMVALNSGFASWGEYWQKVKRQEAPPLLLANEKEIIEFYRYNIKTVLSHDIENLWQIAFRGDGDKPFWATFADAPENETEQIAVINRMLQIQLDLIRELTGEDEPYVRMTFYDELSDMLASGDLKPPKGKNMIWTFCSARRDHYPNDDLVHFQSSQEVKLGYYMNLQFTSTGSHLAPAEGPWKMEANYRYVNGKAPLFFSVLNAGNLREHLFGLSANAKMLWDFEQYDTDRFVLEYCKTYFGEEHAAKAATLYKDFFYSYWEPTKATFPGMERQFLFHDLRHSRAIRMMADSFSNFNPNPLKDIGFERMPGRSFRITPEDNGADNTIDAILNGSAIAAKKFREVADRCDRLYQELPSEYQLFFNDNLRGYARFMAELSASLNSFALAYKTNGNGRDSMEALQRSINEMEKARASLLQTQHDVFQTWYDGDASNGKFNMPQLLERMKRFLR